MSRWECSCQFSFPLPSVPPPTSMLSAELVRAGQQDPGESHEGGHGHLPQDRYHGSSLRCSSAEELWRCDPDVPGIRKLLFSSVLWVARCTLSLPVKVCAVCWQHWPDLLMYLQTPNNQPTLNCRRKQTPLSLNGCECDESVSTSEGEGAMVKEEEHCGSSANQINEEMQRMLNHLWVLWGQWAESLCLVSLAFLLNIFWLSKAGMWVWRWLWQFGLGGDRGDAASLGGLPRLHFASWSHPTTRRGMLSLQNWSHWYLWASILRKRHGATKQIYKINNNWYL